MCHINKNLLKKYMDFVACYRQCIILSICSISRSETTINHQSNFSGFIIKYIILTGWMYETPEPPQGPSASLYLN